MASSTPNVHLFSTIFLLLISLSCAQVSSFRPKALILPVVKDTATLQYVTQINQRTPLLPIRLTVDLGGQFLWVDCDSAAYVSSSYRQARCGSAQCSLAKSGACGGGICGLFPDNTITRTGSYGEVGDDIVALQSTDGSNPGPIVTIPHFIFTCAPTFLLQGLASKVNGMVGLARTRIALPSQFAAAFSLHRKFAVCLSASSTSNGVIFFGDGPYMLLPNIDASKSLIYTPLIINPVSTAGVSGLAEPSDEYFIGVKSIKISEKRVPLNASLLSINNNGFGGTKISTVNPYTTLETSIYKAFSEAFIREATSRNITRAAPVAPFDVCFSSKSIGSTRVGPAVPWVDLVLQSENVYWRIFGANSMVYVNDDVVCLAFVDGGSNPRTSIVIGGHQLENNLLQFDLATSRLGFTSSLLFRQTTCSNFNFTSNV